MFLSGATVPSATRIMLVVGTWLTFMNHGDAILHGSIPWLKVVLDYATPFTVASLGFLAARRRANVERLMALLRDRRPEGLRSSDLRPISRPRAMRIALPKETAARERRVALLPDAVAKLVKAGVEVVVERGAGSSAAVVDGAYADAGARVVDDARAACSGAATVVKVQPPSPDEVSFLEPGSVLISLLPMVDGNAILQALAARKVTALALERVPRISRAQSMDVLSSQATVAGTKAVLLGASALPRLMAMMTTAAGNIPPGKAFVIGAGVAGLQAIATSRRLGAVVSAFDVRAAAREQVQSLGASFVAADLASDARAG